MKKRMAAVSATLGLAALFTAYTYAGQSNLSGPSTAKPVAVAHVHKFSVNQTPIEVLATDPQASKVVEKYLPGLFTHPAYESFKASTLAGLEPFSSGQITDDMLKSIQSELDNIKETSSALPSYDAGGLKLL